MMTQHQLLGPTSRLYVLNMTKPLQQSDKVVESLIALRDELADDEWSRLVDRREMLFKINSCLYDVYPIHGRAQGITND